ncbi:MAG: hypothetical protein ACRD9R_16620, partial [Pyrinomonadaceae bacterium]
VSVTYAYLGDYSHPNLNKRFHRLQESNYHQFLVSKRLGKRAVVSADYTFHAGVETIREGVKIDTRKLRFVDSLRFEAYQRADVRPDFGFAVGAEKKLRDNLTVGGGFARIDSAYHNLNADRFGRGQRAYASATYAITPELSASAFFTRAFANDFTVPNRTRVDAVFSYNFLKTLQRAGLF